MSTRLNVLIIAKDSKQTERYAHLVRDIQDCQIDEMSRIDTAIDWIAKVRYDLLVVDHPQARVVLERVKRIHPPASVIIITEKASIEEAVHLIRLGAEDYLQKPVNTDEFRLAVRRGLDRNSILEGDSRFNQYLNLVNSCQMISSSWEEERALSIVQSYLSRELSSENSGFFFIERNEAENKNNLEWVRLDPKKEGGMDEVFEFAIRSSKAIEKVSISSEAFLFKDKNTHHPSLFLCRMQCVAPKPIYYFCLSPKKPEAMDEFVSRLKILSAQLELTGQNIIRYRNVQEMAYVDDLTGLHNTRYLNRILNREIRESNDPNRKFAVLFMDIDKFKLVNDQHGHVYGSAILAELGQKLRTFVRDNDSLVRYGGDEFVAVLSPCDLASAQQVAERIRKGVENHVFLEKQGLKLKITTSIGIAIYPDHAQNKLEIIEAADQAMYCAKNKSRNTVYVAELKPEAGHT